MRLISSGRALTAALLYLALAPAAFPAKISDIVPKADAIVIGAITGGVQSPENLSLDIDVIRTLKGGPVPPVVHISHPWTRVGIAYPQTASISANFLGIWFLKSGGASGFDVLAASGPGGILPGLFWPAVKTLPPSYEYPAGAALTDAIVFELGAGIESTGRNPETFLYAVESLNTPAVQSVLSRFLKSKVLSFRSAAVAAMLERAQEGSIATLAQVWPSISQDPSRTLVLTALHDAFRDTAPAAVQQLASLASVPAISADLRAAAVNALAAIHTREALPFLATLLQSADTNKRVKGVFGLSSFANGCEPQTPANAVSLAYLQIPASAPYETTETVANFAFEQMPDNQEAALVSFWSSWWNEHPELH